jgi:hypothetical protein
VKEVYLGFEGSGTLDRILENDLATVTHFLIKTVFYLYNWSKILKDVG